MMLDGNNYALDRYMDAVERAEEKCPKCSECGDPIWTETAYEIGGKLICEDCLKDRRVEPDRCVRCGKESDDIYDVDGELLCCDCVDEEFKNFIN